MNFVTFLALVVSALVYATPDFIQNPDGSITAPDGLKWYPAIKNDGGGFFAVGWEGAMKCCNWGPRDNHSWPSACPFGEGGLYLPSADDYRNLRDELGYGTGHYDPTPFPELPEGVFWSSSRYDAFESWSLYGFTGIDSHVDNHAGLYVRCVGR